MTYDIQRKTHKKKHNANMKGGATPNKGSQRNPPKPNMYNHVYQKNMPQTNGEWQPLKRGHPEPKKTEGSSSNYFFRGFGC